MNNLTQTRNDAKRASLDKWQAETLVRYEQAEINEREAIQKHVRTFISASDSEQKSFWEKFSEKLKSLDDLTDLFPLGELFITPGARDALIESGEQPAAFLSRHQRGDWGIICKDDSDENYFSIENGFRIMSVYTTAKDIKIWCITEADRSVTTILLPSEY